MDLDKTLDEMGLLGITSPKQEEKLISSPEEEHEDGVTTGDIKSNEHTKKASEDLEFTP